SALCFSFSRAHRALPSFPTRRSSDLGDDPQRERAGKAVDELAVAGREEVVEDVVGDLPHRVLVLLETLRRDQPHQQGTVIGVGRSEEHTSELQSRENLVCRLLLEKKK